MAASSELQINIKLIENVQMHTCLYDSTSKFYSNSNSKDAAWQKIANKIHLSEKDCKERWRNIRSSYLRYLKNISSSNPTSAVPYYLSEQLQFLKPFTKPKARTDILITFKNNNFVNSSSFLPDQTGTEHNENSIKVLKPSTTSSSAVFAINPRHQNEGSSLDVLNPTAIEYSNTKNMEKLTEKRDDADLDFFKSLLPDFHTLPPTKKRRIKIDIMKLVDEACTEQGQVVPIMLPYSTKTQNGNFETIDNNDSSFCEVNVKKE